MMLYNMYVVILFDVVKLLCVAELFGLSKVEPTFQCDDHGLVLRIDCVIFGETDPSSTQVLTIMSWY